MIVVKELRSYGVGLKETSKSPQNSMTSDPDKVWPGGVLPYQIDNSVGKGISIYLLLLRRRYNLYMFIQVHLFHDRR